MKILKLVGAMLLLAVSFAGCSDNDLVQKGHNVPEGLPAKIKFSIGVPMSNEIEPTRTVMDAEKQIKNLKLIMFSKTKGKQVIPLTDYEMVFTDIDEQGGRNYTIEATVDAWSGVFDTYIVANYNNEFNTFLDENLDNLTQSELEEAIVRMAALPDSKTTYDESFITVDPAGCLPMSGRAQLTIEPNLEKAQVVRFTLSRLMSRIEFEVVSQDYNGQKVEFIPLTYRVCNVPKQAPYFKEVKTVDSEGHVLEHVFNEDGSPVYEITKSRVSDNDEDYFCTEEIQITEGDKFDFVMFENPQGSVFKVNGTKTTFKVSPEKQDGSWPEGYTTIGYHDRDKWDPYNEGTTETYPLSTPADKRWCYAPKHATFVVIKGTISTRPEVGNTMSSAYNGTVYITVHLGNFGTGTKGHMGNFDVNRNELHKYKLTVRGIDNIIADMNLVGEDDKFPGFEGSLTQTSNLFILDAHYEQFMLTLTKADIYKLATAHNSTEDINISVCTPNTNFAWETYSLSSLEAAHTNPDDVRDVHWIQFMKPTEDGLFPQYAGWEVDENSELILDPVTRHRKILNTNPETGMCYISDFLLQVVDAYNENPDRTDYPYMRQITDNGQTVFKTAVFVDEYVYNNDQSGVSRQYLMSEYVNSPNRCMSINRGDPGFSPDKQNTLYGYSMVEIQQRSIKTTMDVSLADQRGDTYDDIFGVETWDETGCYQPGWAAASMMNVGGTAYANGSSFTGVAPGVPVYEGYNDASLPLTLSYGQFNTVMLMKHSSGRNSYDGEDADYYKNVGYLTPPADNTAESHTWSEDMNINIRSNALRAVLTRNRDLNGDGRLTESEIRWYLPALEQFKTIWFGQQTLIEDTRLFEPKDYFPSQGASISSYLDIMDAAPKHYVSSGSKAVIYWADQGASYTDGGEFAKTGNTDWLLCKRHYVRAFRNLPNFRTHAQFPADNYTYIVTGTGKPNAQGQVVTKGAVGVIFVDGIVNVRAKAIDDFYPYHNERSDWNRLYRAFEVSQECNVTNGYSANNLSLNSGETVKGADYLEQTAKAIMSANGLNLSDGWRVPNQRELMLLDHFGYLSNTNNYKYYSSTWFSETTLRTTGQLRVYPFCRTTSDGSSYITLPYGNQDGYWRMVFVRDYQGEKLENPSDNEAYKESEKGGFGVFDN